MIEVVCPDVGSNHPLCVKEDDTVDSSTTTTIEVTDESGGITTVTSSTSTTSVSNDFFEPDYEVVKIVAIEDTVEKADPELEDDDDFIDVPGVITPEQSVAAIEFIEEASEEEVIFDETLIPVGDVTEITDDMDEGAIFIA